MTDPRDAAPAPSDESTGERDAVYGVGPFTVREISLLGVAVVALIVSFFSVAGSGTPSVWNSGLLWILTVFVPVVAVGLVVLRRFSPDGIRRVGSLGIDQFASVAFSVAAVVWLQFVWASVTVAIDVGGAPGWWVQWVELVLMLAGVVLTVGAPLIPVFASDFAGRKEIPAHRVARPARPVAPRPARERAPKPPKEPKAAHGGAPAAAWEQQPGAQGYGTAPQGWDPNAPAPQTHESQAFAPQAYDQQSFAPQAYDQRSAAPQAYEPQPSASAPYDDRPTAEDDDQGYQPVARRTVSDEDPFAVFATDDQATGSVQPLDQTGGQQPSAQQAFWALVPVERDVVDQNGAPLFRIGPTAWALVIEDRGSVFVVRDEDGRTGFLTDTSGVMRG